MTATDPRPEPEEMPAARLARGGRLAESHARTNHETCAVRMQNMTIHDTSGGIPEARRVASIGTRPRLLTSDTNSPRLVADCGDSQSRRAGGRQGTRL